MNDFKELLNTQKKRILAARKIHFIEGLELEFQEYSLISRLNREKETLKQMKRFIDSSFETSWSVICVIFPNLYEFVGTFASIMPTTAAVEGDFSLISWMKDKCRKSMLDLTTEGCMQAKQFQKLMKIMNCKLN